MANAGGRQSCTRWPSCQLQCSNDGGCQLNGDPPFFCGDEFVEHLPSPVDTSGTEVGPEVPGTRRNRRRRDAVDVFGFGFDQAAHVPAPSSRLRTTTVDVTELLLNEELLRELYPQDDEEESP